ncbi:Putative NADH-flavin reductase [Fuerstiella marisgermanici]|uniref:NADH-flavin reductase n=2 Tax=Fuerstiella marisgermanici TaxID=1891926 RepID=A0A1P8WAZ6_9PLAN|nr:NAD(P)-binding oxidoreductase [Fuerstiella marisgermanici]APZ91228.1 Putative NADH-flavin reductase [Fuerstiella marisgermanici]
MVQQMTSLVVGASGATGRLLVEQLLDRGQRVKAIVRSPDKLPRTLLDHQHLTVIQAGIAEASDTELAEYVKGCDAVASCLGHNLTLKGIYGQPRRLVTDAIRRLCNAVKSNATERPVKFVLMNTAGNSNRDLVEPVSFHQKCVIGMLRLSVPPHADNEEAADYLRTVIGQTDQAIEWAVVRPDSLTDESAVSEYHAYPSPTRSAIFNAGKTSRINVAHFMADLIVDDDVWTRWKGQMPVIYNAGY